MCFSALAIAPSEANGEYMVGISWSIHVHEIRIGSVKTDLNLDLYSIDPANKNFRLQSELTDSDFDPNKTIRSGSISGSKTQNIEFGSAKMLDLFTTSLEL